MGSTRSVWSWTISSKALTYSGFDQKTTTTQLSPKIVKPFSLLPPKTTQTNKLLKKTIIRINVVEIKRIRDGRRFSKYSMQVSKNDTETVDHFSSSSSSDDDDDNDKRSITRSQTTEQRLARKRNDRNTYLVAATVSSVGVSSAAILAIYYRLFYCQIQGGEFPLVEIFGTFSLAVGSAVGMEFWARWAHRALWHASLWNMHESHHRPRDGPFEVNDVFAIVNAVPAIALLCYGLFTTGLFPGLCFGAGLGITMFGMAYMFVHDGLVHRRFPVGPIANVPYLKKVAAAHRLHHSEKFKGVPYGLFLGPKEVEVVGGMEELEKEIERIKQSKS